MEIVSTILSSENLGGESKEKGGGGRLKVQQVLTKVGQKGKERGGTLAAEPEPGRRSFVLALTFSSVPASGTSF